MSIFSQEQMPRPKLEKHTQHAGAIPQLILGPLCLLPLKNMFRLQDSKTRHRTTPKTFMEHHKRLGEHQKQTLFTKDKWGIEWRHVRQIGMWTHFIV